jgi:hypothetical protein
MQSYGSIGQWRSLVQDPKQKTKPFLTEMVASLEANGYIAGESVTSTTGSGFKITWQKLHVTQKGNIDR